MPMLTAKFTSVHGEAVKNMGFGLKVTFWIR